MMPATIYKEITIQAPAAQVWQLVGTEAGLRQWWKADVMLEAKPGGRCLERGLFRGAPYQLEGLVTCYEPPRQLTLLLAGKQPGASTPSSMNITITLEEVANTTVVRVVHQVSTVLPMEVMPAAVEPTPADSSSRPIRQPPLILNQLPSHALPAQGTEISTLVPTEPSYLLIDPAGIYTYEVWWTSRLIELLQLMQEKKENE